MLAIALEEDALSELMLEEAVSGGFVSKQAINDALTEVRLVRHKYREVNLTEIEAVKLYSAQARDGMFFRRSERGSTSRASAADKTMHRSPSRLEEVWDLVSTECKWDPKLDLARSGGKSRGGGDKT